MDRGTAASAVAHLFTLWRVGAVCLSYSLSHPMPSGEENEALLGQGSSYGSVLNVSDAGENHDSPDKAVVDGLPPVHRDDNGTGYA